MLGFRLPSAPIPHVLSASTISTVCTHVHPRSHPRALHHALLGLPIAPRDTRNARGTPPMWPSKSTSPHPRGAWYLDLDEGESPHPLGLKHMMPDVETFRAACGGSSSVLREG
ncbi:hypothetical protein BOTBODRAFT_363892 [Botryobasidium botryosum FD-172 SS1]|uniref:Uncharacterized protein n=1 Tax=Botryobasidium botryosum (strain FD-172 SS1) TaxID=930990 RepID=A0A067MP19_BOTB1|nr:hypothetical protein BOTBODRAFT_363892 [Botryobasidium botryosum FD-172 SS1]